jgi:hypothetical protein
VRKRPLKKCKTAIGPVRYPVPDRESLPMKWTVSSRYPSPFPWNAIYGKDAALVGDLPETDQLIDCVGLRRQRASRVEMEFSVSAIIDRITDQAAEEVSVA